MIVLATVNWKNGQNRKRPNRQVFNRFLKVSSDGENTTSDDKLFHSRAAATGMARSPIVTYSVRGMTSDADDADLRRRRDYIGHTVKLIHQVLWCLTM